MTGLARAADLAQRAAEIADRVVAPAAADVDVNARFPQEAVDALRAAGLLAALIPTEYGGGGAALAEVAGVTEQLGRACASTAMISAMHQIQVACLVNHGSTPYLRELLREIARDGLLLASATTEVGIGGDVRSSACTAEHVIHVEHGEYFALTKQAPLISYGAYADIILATARRTTDSPPNDQSLVVCRYADAAADSEQLGGMGFAIAMNSVKTIASTRPAARGRSARRRAKDRACRPPVRR